MHGKEEPPDSIETKKKGSRLERLAKHSVTNSAPWCLDAALHVGSNSDSPYITYSFINDLSSKSLLA